VSALEVNAIPCSHLGQTAEKKICSRGKKARCVYVIIVPSLKDKTTLRLTEEDRGNGWRRGEILEG